MPAYSATFKGKQFLTSREVKYAIRADKGRLALEKRKEWLGKRKAILDAGSFDSINIANSIMERCPEETICGMVDGTIKAIKVYYDTELELYYEVLGSHVKVIEKD
jgi:hypothetical protein